MIGGRGFAPNLAGNHLFPLAHANSPVPTLDAWGAPAFTYANASSQRLSNTTGVPVTAFPLTIGCWAHPTNNAITSSLVYFGDSNDSSGSVGIDISGTEANDPLRAFSGASASKANNTPFNTWSHFAGVFASTTSRTAYLNGVAGTTDTTSVSGLSLTDRLDVGALFRSDYPSGVNFFAGSIGEVQIWNVALSAALVARIADKGSRFELWYPLRSRKWISAAGYTHPTLSAATALEIGATSFKPSVTYTFA